MSLDRFGPFANVFAVGELSVPGHLALLSLGDKDSQTVIDRVARAMAEDDPQPWIATMLSDPNWRPHVVAAVAYLLDSGRRLDRGLLWKAMDAGSWVTPQLAVTACYADMGFVAAARDRIARRCPVNVPGGLTPAERHSATGPQGSAARAAKMLVSLLTACDEIPRLAPWAASVRCEPDILPLLPVRVNDDAARIVTEWRARIRLVFHARGVELRPRAE